MATIKNHTQEEKAKAYDEAIIKVKALYGQSLVNNTLLETIFPELKESEDEKIRNTLIGYFKVGAENNERTGNIADKDILAWLEKQESVGEIVERCKDSWYNEGKIQGQIEGLTDEEKYQQGWHDALEKRVPVDKDEDEKIRKELIKLLRNLFNNYSYFIKDPFYTECITWLEKQGEKLQSKDIKPKFHEGNLIMHKGTKNIYQVVALIGDQYQLKYGDNYTVQKCAEVDKCSSLIKIKLR